MNLLGPQDCVLINFYLTPKKLHPLVFPQMYKVELSSTLYISRQ